MPKLGLIVASTRPRRVGLPVAQWFLEKVQERNDFEVTWIDLQEVNLPFLDEPQHPRLRQYVHEHTKAWSRLIDEQDAFVFVHPEYNFAMTAPLKNALDYLHWEWHYKPVGLVSYGGVSAGLRAAQQIKQVVTTLKMMPLFESVSIPFVAQFIRDGVFVPNDVLEKAAPAMLEELKKWEEALRPLRQEVRSRMVRLPG